MGAILPILVALNIVFASVAAPVFIAGVGLGSGAEGSSFSQKTSLLSNGGQLKEAYLIFKNSCDEKEWAESVSYPKSADELRTIINNKALLENMENGQSTCKPLNKGKSGIIHVGGNDVEMAHLLIGRWDKRVLESVAYIIRKRSNTSDNVALSRAQTTSLLGEKALAATSGQLETAGYQEKCEYGDKSAPFLTIRTTAGYMDSNGQPTALAKSGDEDDPEAADTNNNAISPHGRGQAVDFLSVGCTVIKKDNEIKQVIANNLATGQDNKGSSSAPGIEFTDQMAAQSIYADSELMTSASEEIYENNDTLYTSGIDQAQREGLATALLAADVIDPDIQPEIIPANEISSQSPVASYAEKTAKIAERVIEKQRSLPAGSLSLGANSVQLGRAILYSQTGVLLGPDPSTQEIATVAFKLSSITNPLVSLQVPPQGITLLKDNQPDKFLNLVAANRINNQFSQNWSANEISKKADTGISSDELLEILKKDTPTSDQQDEEMLTALSSGGSKELTKTLEKMQDQQDQSTNGSLRKILLSTKQLNKNQITKLNDFNDPNYRSGVADRLKALGAPQELVDWTASHKNLSADEAKIVSTTITNYCASQNGKETIKNQQGDVYDNIVRASVKLMKPDEQEIFNSIVGTNPSADTLKAAFSDGRIEKAGEAVVYSRTLQQLGVPSSQSTYLAIGVSSGKMDGLQTGLGRFNSNFSQYGIMLTKSDFALSKDGQFPAASKLALGILSQKTGITLSSLQKAFSGRDQSAQSTASAAIAKNIKMSAQVKGMLDGVFATSSDGGKGLSSAASKAGAKAQAVAIAAGISGAGDERAKNADKIEKAFNESIDASGSSALDEAKNLLVEKGTTENSAKDILKGDVKGSGSSTAVNFVAKNLASKGYGDQGTLAKVLSGKATASEKFVVGDVLAKGFLAENNIYVSSSTSITGTIVKGKNEQRQALAQDIGGQYVVNQMTDKIGELTGVDISLTPLQKQQFADGNFSALSSTGSQTAQVEASNKLSEVTGGVVKAETITQAYNNLKDDGVLSDGNKEDIGWGVMEENLGFGKDTVKNFDNNLQNTSQSFVESYNTQAMEAQLSGIGAGIIVSTLIGNQLVKIDPTGGLLTVFACQYATSYILTLGISMPILLGIAFIINPAATIQAIKGMIMLATVIFTDPIGTIMGLFGFGKKKPKLESAVTNPTAKNKDTIKDPSTYVDSPTNTDSDQMTAFAADNNSGKDTKVQATSDYLPSKKPTKEYIKKISRRTTDQTVEDLLLMGLVFAANRQVQKAEPDFIQNHWTRYMGSSGQTLSFAIKQLVSPRAPVTKDKQASAQGKGVKDFLYEKEHLGGAVGLDFTVDLSRLVFGQDSSPLENSARTTGLDISSSVYEHVHLSF